MNPLAVVAALRGGLLRLVTKNVSHLSTLTWWLGVCTTYLKQGLHDDGQAHRENREGNLMQRQFVESSMIEWLGYDEATQTLTIRFRAGGLYEYHGVPRQEYEGLVRSPSVGRYFSDHIRDIYPYAKVRVRRV